MFITPESEQQLKISGKIPQREQIHPSCYGILSSEWIHCFLGSIGTILGLNVDTSVMV